MGGGNLRVPGGGFRGVVSRLTLTLTHAPSGFNHVVGSVSRPHVQVHGRSEVHART